MTACLHACHSCGIAAIRFSYCMSSVLSQTPFECITPCASNTPHLVRVLPASMANIISILAGLSHPLKIAARRYQYSLAKCHLALHHLLRHATRYRWARASAQAYSGRRDIASTRHADWQNHAVQNHAKRDSKISVAMPVIHLG